MSVRRHLAWMGLSQSAFFLIQFASSVAVARLLSPYETGIYAVALAVVGVVSTVQAFGLAGFIVREPELSPRLLVSAFTLNGVISLFLSSGIFLLSFAGAAYLHEAGVRRVLMILSVAPLIGAVEFLPASMLEREARFRTIAIIGTCRAVVAQAVTVTLAVLHFSYLSMAYGQLVGAVTSAALYFFAGRGHFRLQFGLADWRRLGAFGVRMLAIGGLNSLSERSGEFALGRLSGLAALGIYSRSSNLANLAWENIHLVTGRVLFVDLASIKREGRSLDKSYLRIVDVSTLFLWPIMLGLGVISGPLIWAVYGERWTVAAKPLAALTIALCIYVARPMTWELFVISDETRLQARIEFVRTTTTLILFCAGATISLLAAAASRILAALFATAFYWKHVNRMTDTCVSDVNPIYTRNLVLTAIAVLPASLVMWLHGFSERTPLYEVLASVGLGVVCWSSALAVTQHELALEALLTLKTRIAARRRSGVRPL